MYENKTDKKPKKKHQAKNFFISKVKIRKRTYNFKNQRTKKCIRKIIGQMSWHCLQVA